MVALMSSGVTDSSLKYHLENAKNHGVTRKDRCGNHPCGILCRMAKGGWAVFHMAKEVWTDELSAKGTSAEDARYAHAAQMIFQLVSQTMLLLSILSDKAILHQFQSIRWESIM